MQSIPFSYASQTMIEDIIDDSIENLNRSSRKKVISKHLIPFNIATGSPKLDFSKLKLSFGENYEACEDDICKKIVTTREACPLSS